MIRAAIADSMVLIVGLGFLTVIAVIAAVPAIIGSTCR